MKVRGSEQAFVVEVARYLLVDPEDVRRMIQMDGMPAFSIPKKTRPVLRIPLRGLHAWLMKRARGGDSGIQSYDKFRDGFMAAREGVSGQRSAVIGEEEAVMGQQ